MHEYSVVSALLEQCERYAAENHAISVNRVAIKVGVLSGVEPTLLETAFDTFKLQGICRQATLEIQRQPLVIQCQECDEVVEVSQRAVYCPRCNSYYTKVIEGEDLLLMQLEFETA